MCKIRLNFYLKLVALMNQSKRFNGSSFDSVSSYYMSGCKCSKDKMHFGYQDVWKLHAVNAITKLFLKSLTLMMKF